MLQCSIVLILFTIFGSIVEIESHSIRHRRSRCKTNKDIRVSEAAKLSDSLDVIWSPDGVIGVKYFESDGRKFTEVHEVVPISGGKYHQIVKKVVEATTSSPHLPGMLRSDESHKKSSDYNDVTWYEPPGQQSYPRLLFSPRYGWREMNANEIEQLNVILPIAEYRPDFTHSNRYPSSRPHKVQKETNRLDQPYDENHHNIMDNNGRLQHQQVIPQKRNQVETDQKTWVFRDGSWSHRNPENRVGSVMSESGSAPERNSNVVQSPVMEWIFLNGSWHRQSQLQKETYAEQLQNKQPIYEALVKARKLLENDLPSSENVATMDTGLGDSRHSKENDTSYDKLDSTRRSYGDYNFETEVEHSELSNVEKESDLDGGKFENRHQILAHHVHREDIVAAENVDTDDELKQSENDFSYINNDDVGVLAHSASESHQIRPDNVHMNATGQLYSSNDSEHVFMHNKKNERRRKIRILSDPSVYQCGQAKTVEESEDFWLLRRHPCDENSEEHLIQLPNGEVLKFYGKPLLVTV